MSTSGIKEQPKPHVPVETVVRSVQKIATIPHVALHVIELANDPDIGARELKQAMESDPALSARVLRCVNSSAYALRSRVGNLQQAISLLGFNQVRNLAITSSVSECFQTGRKAGPYDQGELWKHLVAVAVCARLVATRCKIVNFEDAFLAGLLHDVGIVIADQHVSEEFRTMMRSIDDTKSLIESEREYLGFDHCELGGRLAEMWKFPPAVQETISWHHSPERCKGEHAMIVDCVAIANLVCTLKGMTSVGLKMVALPVSSMQDLNLDKQDLKLLVTDLDQELENNQALFAN